MSREKANAGRAMVKGKRSREDGRVSKSMEMQKTKTWGECWFFSIQLVSQQLFSRSNGLSIDLNTVSKIKAKDREKGL